MKLRSMIRPKTDVDGEQKHTIEVEGSSYDDCVAQVDAQTPDGWIKLYVMPLER
ncbi:hypothetical protein [Nocardioides soli]|uniref:Uncharacterized protein n=1 Tax=Nocardioides soli TaxID=1036020 RepID=A0A7W4VT24_9ACTN|nr:hypothetical protein [Nocardioides soli]MBB3041243.1 hypothetical protein [Nocardioides soli]